jgi:hypothetical protein
MLVDTPTTIAGLESAGNNIKPQEFPDIRPTGNGFRAPVDRQCQDPKQTGSPLLNCVGQLTTVSFFRRFFCF